MAIDMLREAGRPLAIKEMALAALKAKGVRLPDRRTTKQTRVRLRDVFVKLEARGRSADGGDREGDAADVGMKNGNGRARFIRLTRARP
jgi:hypothetical protein